MSENSWQCPYCGHFQVLQEGQNLRIGIALNLTSISKYEYIGCRLWSIACLHCKELTLDVNLNKVYMDQYRNRRLGDLIRSWRLMPNSRAKPQPNYIPKYIIANYEEACKIADLSPKASAMLARRCLESIIKDFCKIEGSKNLATMIDQVQQKANENREITEESLKTIEYIRKKGNIAAHIQKPTNQMIDNITKADSDFLIELLEMLFQEWYIASHKRKERLEKIEVLVP